MSSFDLKRLRYFLAVAELGSITRAASELHIAQPALSHQIHLLENETGVQLFERGSHGVRLTEQGNVLVKESSLLLRNIHSLRDRFRERSTEPQGEVVIGLSQTIAPVLALSLFELATQRLPHVRINIRELMSSNIPDLLRSESIDFAFSYAIPAGRGIRSINIFSENLFLVGSSDCAKKYFKKSNVNNVAFSDLAGVPLYLSARSNGFREELEKIARRAKIKLNVVADIDSVFARKEIALGGVGFTVLSGSTIRREILQNDIFAAKISNPNIRRKICFVRRSNSTLSRASQAVAELIAESITSVAKRNRWPGALPPTAELSKLT